MHTAQLCSTQPFDLISFSLVSSATLSTSAAAISSLFCFLHQFQPPSPSLDQHFNGNESGKLIYRFFYSLLSLHSCLIDALFSL
jgi:hypothetical protein